MTSANTGRLIEKAAELIKNSKYTTAFTGAGISVESGIPPFRGPQGLWSKYNPIVLDIDYFKSNPLESWKVIKEIFYDFFGKAKPNAGHIALARLEKAGYIKNIITQNIDNLHQEAGSQTVYEFHGNSHTLVCTGCGKHYSINQIDLNDLPVLCSGCGGLVKPDFIFFGEGIPPSAYQASIEAANSADVFLVIGTTGEIMPASQIPYLAKQNGAKIIEINTEPSNYTGTITDVFLKGKAGNLIPQLAGTILP
jgi:NAD-dependent deacetylase